MVEALTALGALEVAGADEIVGVVEATELATGIVVL